MVVAFEKDMAIRMKIKSNGDFGVVDLCPEDLRFQSSTTVYYVHLRVNNNETEYNQGFRELPITESH